MEYSKNKFACEVMDGKIQDDRYRVIEDFIFYKGRVYLVPDSGLKKKDISERQQKWVTKVWEFDYDIEYVKGKKNIMADALSRRPASCSLMEISVDCKSHLLVEYSKNKFSCEVMDGKIQNE